MTSHSRYSFQAPMGRGMNDPWYGCGRRRVEQQATSPSLDRAAIQLTCMLPALRRPVARAAG
jgi:hypothetical protein